jgi:hypothetical protein
MESVRFVVAALALGAISLWASENMFWIVPPPGWSLTDWLITWIAYSCAAATALAMVSLSGIGGLSAALDLAGQGVGDGTLAVAFERDGVVLAEAVDEVGAAALLQREDQRQRVAIEPHILQPVSPIRVR